MLNKRIITAVSAIALAFGSIGMTAYGDSSSETAYPMDSTSSERDTDGSTSDTSSWYGSNDTSSTDTSLDNSSEENSSTYDEPSSDYWEAATSSTMDDTSKSDGDTDDKSGGSDTAESGTYADSSTASAESSAGSADSATSSTSAINITIEPQSYVYDGTSKKPSVIVKENSKVLIENVDYTVSYPTDTINAGEKWIVVEGIFKKDPNTGDSYSGWGSSCRYNIMPAELTSASLKKTTYNYTGKAITPDVTVMSGTKTLVKDTDYTVIYSNNVNEGIATATITGKGNYTGTITNVYTIAKAASKTSITKAKFKFSSTSITYTGKAKMPKLTVTYNGKTLVKGTDYKVTVSNAKKVGKATAKITGIGDYTGTKKLTYYVVPVKPTISSVKSSAKKKATVKWKKNTTATGYQIQVSLKKNFSGKKSYSVSKNSTVKATISKLTSGKTYYVRMRCYKTIDGTKRYSAYSAVKTVKVK